MCYNGGGRSAAMMLIESQQAIYRGPRFDWPTEVWSVKDQVWKPYKGSVPKEIGWGDVVTDAEASEFMRPI